MMKLMLAACLSLFAPAVHAAGIGCQDTTGPLRLEKIRSGTTGTYWIGCINRSFDTIVSSLPISNSTITWARFGRVDVSTVGAYNSARIYFSSPTVFGAGVTLPTIVSSLTIHGAGLVIGNLGIGAAVSSAWGSGNVLSVRGANPSLGLHNGTNQWEWILGAGAGDANLLAAVYNGTTMGGWTPAGELGVGTADPTSKLHVVGTVHATGAVEFDSTLQMDGALTMSNGTVIWFKDVDVGGDTFVGGIYTGNNDWTFFNQNSRNIRFDMNNGGSTAMMLDNDGDVAIGGDTSIGHKLMVKGASNLFYNLGEHSFKFGNGNVQFYEFNSDASGTLKFRNSTTSKDIWSVDAGTMVFVNAIRLKDGTELSSAISTTTVARSSFTIMCNGDQTPSVGQNTQGTAVAVTGSTLTMTTSANSWVEACVNMQFTADTTEWSMDILVDGARPSWVGSNGAITCSGFGGTVTDLCTKCVPLSGLSAGSHSFTLMAWRGANPVTIEKSNPCSTFMVKEWR